MTHVYPEDYNPGDHMECGDETEAPAHELEERLRHKDATYANNTKKRERRPSTGNASVQQEMQKKKKIEDPVEELRQHVLRSMTNFNSFYFQEFSHEPIPDEYKSRFREMVDSVRMVGSTSTPMNREGKKSFGQHYDRNNYRHLPSIDDLNPLKILEEDVRPSMGIL